MVSFLFLSAVKDGVDNGRYDDDSLHHQLPVGADIEKVHPVVDDAHEERAEEHARRRAFSSAEGHAAHCAGSNGLCLKRIACRGLCGGIPGRQYDACQGRADAADHIGVHDDPPGIDAGVMGCLVVAAHRVHGAAKGGP